MGDYGWSMDFGTSQGSVAVEHDRVLEFIYYKENIKLKKKKQTKELKL